MELSIGKILKCPSGIPDQPDLTFEMAEIYRLEARQQEQATVSKGTAPELMQAFIDGYGQAARALVQLKWELTQAKKFAEQRRAVVNLEVAPEYLAEKGFVKPSNPAGTADQRESVLAMDKEYLALSDRVSMIEAASEFMRLKAHGFEMSYQAVKKVFDSLTSSNVLANGYDRHAMSASPFESIEETKALTQTTISPIAIGRPRY